LPKIFWTLSFARTEKKKKKELVILTEFAVET